MKNRTLTLLLLPTLFFLTSCFSLVNLTNDNATLLNQKEVRVSGHYAHYYYSKFLKTSKDDILQNQNFGGSLIYGVSNRLNLTARAERLHKNSGKAGLGYEAATNLTYLEVGTKIKLKKDKVALGLPLGFYLIDEDDSVVVLTPHLFLTHRLSQRFDMNLTTRLTIGLQRVTPGISLNIGLSSDLDKWAIRPEIGFDSNSMGWGIGASYRFAK